MIEVAIEPDFDSWRAAAKSLLTHQIPPADVFWNDAGPGILSSSQLVPPLSRECDSQSALRVPADFVPLCKYVACHRNAERWAIMYRLLWRLTHGERRLLDLAVDDDVRLLTMMHKAVSRDRHKMTAFVRFRQLLSEGGERYVAWHCPDHHIVRLTAPFFAERFAAMNWTILTPDQSVSWDGGKLAFGPGTPRRGAPSPDQLEALWKTYYGSIFNPARVNLDAMRKEMPVRHWATLPETEIIPELLRDAPRRIQEMARHSNAARRAGGSTPGKLLVGKSLVQLREEAANCRGCDLYCQATQTVFGEGPDNARVVFVGEQPGDEEDRAGRPFVGPAGQLLNAVFEETGIDRREVYVTNAVKHFKWEPRGKRRIHKTPSAREVVACSQWLQAELTSIRPPLLVCLGATAARAVFGRDFQLTARRGQAQSTQWSPWTMATWHPSALLRIPDANRRAQVRLEFANDLRQVADELKRTTK